MESLDLTARKELVVGIANEHSLAWCGCGAELTQEFQFREVCHD
jgi:enoyl-[acyl-carrier-protein] reductase (NADH)